MEPVVNSKQENECGNPSATSPSSSTSGGLSDDSSEKTTYPFLGSAEDAFIQAGLNLTTVSEITEAVEKCKGMVLNTKEYSEERKWLVRYLIELRLRLEEAREAEVEHRKLMPSGTPQLSPSRSSETSVESEISKTRDKRFLLGHHFFLQAPATYIMKCDRCCRNIWGILHVWYECVDCQYRCHMKCLEKIKRQCASVRVCETPFYSNDICPEIGLAAQGYQCHECKTLISYKSSWHEPRQCDYDGYYYCTKCHWDTLSVIPARVVHNWDFSERKVCNGCFHFLRLMINRPVVNIDALNPQLFQFVEDLAALKKLRSQLLLMKQYLTTCPGSLKGKNKKKLVWSLNPHFVENPTGLFSLQDLIDVNNKSLLTVLQEVAHTSTEHIKGCRICKGKGYFCELCHPQKEVSDSDILFPFDNALSVFVCPKCSAVYHRDCWMKRSVTVCPRCERMQDRQSVIDETLEL